MAVDTYYFDASDDAVSDPDGVWTNDANAFDGNTVSYAIVSTNGDTSSNYLFGGGTTAPTTGDTITQVRARMSSSASASFGSAAVYTDGLAELLGTADDTGGAGGFGSYTTLSTPSGGWTWAKVAALEVKIYRPSGMSGTLAAIVEVEVTSTAISPSSSASPSSSISASRSPSASTSPSSSSSGSASPSSSVSLSRSPSSSASPSASQSPSSSTSLSLSPSSSASLSLSPSSSASLSASPSASASASISPSPSQAFQPTQSNIIAIRQEDSITIEKQAGVDIRVVDG